jgi:hypothetical protein
MPQTSRRNFLVRCGVLGASLFAPTPWAEVWAQQSDGALRLIRLPKLALVVGNGGYRDAPVLKNPVNDASAIADVLTQSGFQVTLATDASRAQMLQAIQSYTAALAAKKCVGLFYFAGHGLQLAWRNYLLPVDAGIDRVADVSKQGVDVGRLMESLSKASNAMNVVILDACRENPFGKETGEVRGLSQMDAPPSTLLAYATSPGNVASDGSGAHGLYTENLLREIRVKDAKIEDVFKRVRLSVRRKSNGDQIPWESTSLEEDFYFSPPENLKKLSEQERAQLFREEEAIWTKVVNAKEPGPVEDYLRRYPNGNFSEVAQLRLNILLAKLGEKPIVTASSAGNPYTKGSATANSAYRLGDQYQYRRIDTLTKVEAGQISMTVTEVTDDRVIYDAGLVTDLLGNEWELPNGFKLSPAQRYPLEYAVGKRWTTRYRETHRNGSVAEVVFDFQVVAREKITLPAGTFDAFRIEGQGHLNYPNIYVAAYSKAWMAPDQFRRPVAMENFRKTPHRIVASDRFELLSAKQT